MYLRICHFDLAIINYRKCYIPANQQTFFADETEGNCVDHDGKDDR